MFNFLSDTVLELVLSTDTDYSYQTTVTYDREALLQAISNRDFTFFFQTRLAAIVELLRNAAIPEQFASIVSSFSSICDRVLAEDPEATLEDLVNSGLVDESGKATFVDNVTESFKDVVVTVHYAIALWTGKASFKVGGTSCTLSGTIHCASEDFNTYGTYGIRLSGRYLHPLRCRFPWPQSQHHLLLSRLLRLQHLRPRFALLQIRRSRCRDSLR